LIIHRAQIELLPCWNKLTSQGALNAGRPVADTICMILIIIRMKVLAEKRKELSQTIIFLIGYVCQHMITYRRYIRNKMTIDR